MRFLELRAEEVIQPVKLHPHLTLVRGLDPAAYVALVGFLHSVASGDTFGWEGTVEVHGVETSLANALDLAGHTTDAAQTIEASTLIDGARAMDASETGAPAERLTVCE